MSDSLASVDAAILAGGFGTRLRSVVSDRPKVLAEVAGRPFITFLLDQLVTAGVRSVVLCTGYMADLVESTLGETYGPLKLHYSRETTPLGTGGAVRAAMPHLRSATVLVLNGDSYCQSDLTAFYAKHVERNAKASILLTHVPDAGRYGSVSTDTAGLVTEFAEKRPNAGPGWINAGFYLIERDLLAGIPEGQAVSIERDVFPQWIGRGLNGVPIGQALLDIGTPESLAAATTFLKEQGLC
jgi:D-glycero-alpha-D-manno-heptose 1-phosphate guanylyltransferase